ncbi:MAG: hypothetical protein IAF38_14245, partial [Bacteroidia bacterium]|nr:hypothetical protein [Bacteroidia bacterium]
MCRIFLFSILFFSGIFFSAAQNTFQPVKYNYENKEYFVYPVRTGNVSGIPPTGFNCPDGDYILFSDYEFRSKLLKKEMSLLDTTKVSAIFGIKNNLPNGNAVFFGYDFTNYYSSKLSTTPTTEEEGDFENGLKQGEWIKKMVNSKWARSHPDANKTICNYNKGLLEGKWTEFDSHGDLQKTENYKNDRLADTVSFYSNGKIILQYDIYDALLDTVRNRPDNFFDLLLRKNERFQVLGAESLAKSFYKSWDENGKLINSIKFNNGKNPEFDTLQINPTEKLIITTNRNRNVYGGIVVTEFNVKTISESWNSVKTTEDRYRMNDVFFSYMVNYNKKTKTSDSSSYSIYDTKVFNETDWFDYEWGEKYNNGIKSILHIVPAIGYTWEEIHYMAGKKQGAVYLKQKPLSIDSSLQIVHTRDTFFYFPSSVKKIQEI